MKQKIDFSNFNVRNNNLASQPTGSSRNHTENVLTPVRLTGVLVPKINGISGGPDAEFKLVCPGGFEYQLCASTGWKEVLAQYSLEEVKVIGLLNITNKILVPQKIFPKGSQGELEKVIDLAEWNERNFVKKLVADLGHIEVAPALDFADVTV